MSSNVRRPIRKKCTCNYKCKHTLLGMQMVSQRTFYEHYRQDAHGNVHPSVRRNIEEATQLMNAASSMERRQLTPSSKKEAKKVWCNCASYCNGGRMIAHCTYRKHQLLQQRYVNLGANLGFPPSVHHDEIPQQDQNPPLDEDSVHNFSREDSEHEEFGNPGNDEEMEELSLEDQIIERCIELQTLWDKFQTPIKFQDEMLQILFGDMGAQTRKRNDGKRKPSLGKLLVQLPSTWDGDLGGMKIPACWKQLNSFYAGLGMTNVQRFKLCTGSKDNPHDPEVLPPSNEDNYTGSLLYCICVEDARKKNKLKRDCLSCCERCTKCNFPRKDMVVFDYAPIGPQLQLLAKSRTICHELLRMWRNNERWLGKDLKEHPKSVHEFWDGEKCRAVQKFWDPNSFYELPVICQKYYCRKIYTTFPKKSQILQDGWNEQEGLYNFACEKCRSSITCEKKICKGDPRNFALLLHSDGFQASRTTQKDCGVFEIVILNAGKSSNIEILPVLFIPFSSKKLIRNSVDILGAFMRPLVTELESLFVDGIELCYNYPSKYLSSHVTTISKNCHLRAMLMMITGDHPAQCKVGLFKDGGQAFCRRDKAQSTLTARNENYLGRYLYDGNRYQARYPPCKRSIHEMVEALSRSKRACNHAEKEEILRSAGLSGESVLWRLYDLYDFNLSMDLVYDVMHILSLNLFRKYISCLMKESSNEMKKSIDAAVVEVSKAIPRSIRYGRWPQTPSKYHGSFKAEENQKFIQWCLPYIFGSVIGISEPLRDLGLLLIDIAHLFYNYSRDNGWSSEDMDAVRQLFLSWRVRSEESYGPNSSPLEHVAGNGEILDDIYRHGMHDVYWCFAFERKVSNYVNISTNNRSNEVSYAQYYRRKLFTLVFEHIQRDKDGLMPFERMLAELHASLILPDGYVHENISPFMCSTWHECGVLEVSSVAKAKEIWKAHMLFNHEYICEKLVENKGIAITKKKKQYRVPKKEEIQYAEFFWGIERNNGHFERVRIYKKIFFRGELYVIGDEVVVKVDEDTNVGVSVGHWKARITSFFALQHNGTFMIFFGAEYYKQQILIHDGIESLMIDRDTGMSVLDRTRLPFTWNCIRPITSLLHKFIVFSRGSKLLAYETKDLELRKRLLNPGFPGCVPPWPKKSDIVLVQCNSNDIFCFRHAVLREVDFENKLVQLAWLKPDQRQNGQWKVELEETIWRPWSCCITILTKWIVVGSETVQVNGELKQISTIWQTTD